jgi:hypothetical protein
MRDFGSWFSEQGKGETEEVDEKVWLRCYGCAKDGHVSIKAMKNGDTGWYVEGEVEADGTYNGLCGGSQFCVL